MFDIEALTHSVGWLLRKYGGRLDSAKLVKLMYIADREAMKDDGASITGDDYCALDKGPAAAKLSNPLSLPCKLSACWTPFRPNNRRRRGKIPERVGRAL